MDWVIFFTVITVGIGILGIINNIKADINGHIDRLETRMDKIEIRIENRMNSFEKRMSSMDERIFYALSGKRLEDVILEQKAKAKNES